MGDTGCDGKGGGGLGQAGLIATEWVPLCEDFRGGGEAAEMHPHVLKFPRFSKYQEFEPVLVCLSVRLVFVVSGQRCKPSPSRAPHGEKGKPKKQTGGRGKGRRVFV